MRLPHASLAVLPTLLLLTACRDPKVAHYRVPKETPPAPPPGMTAGDMASTAVPTAQGEGLAWSAPAHWHAKAPAAMRRGSYDVNGADLSITAFPGDVGGELANINRWRGQLQLPPLTAAQLPDFTTLVQVNGLDFVVVDFVNAETAPPERILGAFTHYEGNTWFFKLRGPDTLVAGEKPAFLDFLQTVKAP